MAKSPMGRSLDDIVQARAARDPAFAQALLEEAVERILAGDMSTARSLIRDAIKGSIGYAELSTRTGTPEKSLVRMFGPSGNPTAANISSVLKELQHHGRMRLCVRSEPAVLSRAARPVRKQAASRSVPGRRGHSTAF